jgi:hypothetical protein
MGIPDSTDPTSEERRRARRHLACFPAYVGTGDESTNIALIRDISVKGALLLTRERFEKGDTIELSMYVSGEPDVPPRIVPAKIVRFERRQPEQADLWLYSAAVEFDEPQQELEDELRQLEDHQKQLGLHRG